MKKYFGLSNREETVLRILDSTQKWIDGIVLSVLNIAAFYGAIATLSNKFDFDKIVKGLYEKKNITVGSGSAATKQDVYGATNYTKGALWVIAILLLTRTTVYFAKMYLESKVVSDYESTEGIERN